MLVVVGILVVCVIDVSSDDCGSKHLCEEQRESEASESPQENRHAGSVDWLIDCVVGGIGCPACCEAENGSSEGENRACFRSPNAHRDVIELAGMGKLAKNNQEDDQAWDPRIALIGVHNLIPEKRNEEGCNCDDQNAGPARHVAIHSIEQLGAHNDIDRGPADTSENIETGDY